jgi:hypothetical protein
MGWGTFTCAEGAAIVNAGERAAGKEAAAAAAALGESLCCCASDELPPELCDGEAAVVVGSWVLEVLADTFTGWWGAGLFFIGTADAMLAAVAAEVAGDVPGNDEDEGLKVS